VRRGSLFLNVGAKPKDPWTALDVAQAARPHLELQNIIHWVKSIAIDQEAAGVAASIWIAGQRLHERLMSPVPLSSNLTILPSCHKL